MQDSRIVKDWKTFIRCSPVQIKKHWIRPNTFPPKQIKLISNIVVEPAVFKL